MSNIEIFKPVSIKTLKQILKAGNQTTTTGLLFCFGTSFISKLIQAKTRLYTGEVVPSHVAMIYNGFIYESTTSVEHVRNKTIGSGVRRWMLEDFLTCESKKKTTYVFVPYPLCGATLEAHVHLPYGKDTIVDYLMKDKSIGDSKGLICSQYANLCCGLIITPCCTPADLFRAAHYELTSGNKEQE